MWNDVVTWVTANPEEAIAIAGSVLYLLTHLAAVTPTKFDNKVLQGLRVALDYIAANYGKTKNRE